mmetsp:Transcript_41469/g.29906  ORF Transcript_41469/g.29906 Transcript_41469/m.29906 type:complete len:81 (-) Transcript_41469:178-420(-)
MIFSGGYPLIYYGFACDSVFWLKTLLLCIFFLFTTATTIVVLLPKLDRPEYRSFRVALFVILGLCLVVPICILSQDGRAD